MEQKIHFDATGGVIEGLLDRRSEENGLVITHPHPHYGGDMHNTIVEVVKTMASDYGYTTLRFNFRGTGRSEGHFDDGVGEQSDLLCAVSYLKKLGLKRVDLAGYSFGAWVIAKCFEKKEVPVERVMFVAPPIDFIEFPNGLKIPDLMMVACGDQDAFASFKDVKRLSACWNPKALTMIIPGADHFFSGALKQLQKAIAPFFNA